MRNLVGLAVGLLILASCDRPYAPGEASSTAAPAFRHSLSSDLSGYYRPATEVRIGKWSFDHVFVGQAAEFRAWEGGTRSGTFSPVMLEFEDTSSPMIADKFGGSVAHIVSARVLPTAYAVTDSRIRFEGRLPEMGAVRFDGVLDPGGLVTARRNLGDDGVVVTGTLTVGDSPPQTVRLRWWVGD